MSRRKTNWIRGPTPLFKDHFKIVEPLNGIHQSLLVYGYIRVFEQNKNNCNVLLIPREITTLILYFYHTKSIMKGAYIISATYPCICQQTTTRKSFVVKIVNKNRFYRIPIEYRPRYMRAMSDEFDMLSRICHPNIVHIQSIFEDKTNAYIVSEECTGGTLFNRIIEKGSFTEYDASKIIKQIVNALRYMHFENGIVHCSLNPENIYFVNKSDDLSIKIDDFGFSKVLPRLNMNILDPTPYYTAPEVIRQRKFNHGCDIWSVGIILYVMIFGYPPFCVDPEKYGKAERTQLNTKIKRGFISRVRSTERRGFGPWFPDHINASKEVKHLISKLLEYKVRKRYTASEALTHSWIVNPDAKHLTLNLSVDSLVKFSNMCQLKNDVIILFRDQFDNMTSKDFIELKQLFIKMDTNCDGVIYCNELVDILSQMTNTNMDIDKKWVYLLFQSKHQTGIHFESLLHGLIHDYLVFCDELLYREFRILDDDNGKIETKQLKYTFKRHDKLNEWSRGLKIINEQQLDSNGVIEYEDFLLNLHPTFNDDQFELYNVCFVEFSSNV